MSWLLMTLTALAAIAIVTLPWWRRRTSAGRARRRALNVAAYRQRLVELEADIAADVLDRAVAEEAKRELGARLLSDAAADAPAEAASRGRPVWLAALLLPAYALAWYVLDGSWRVQQQIAESGGAHGTDAAQMTALTEQLAQRMQQQPDNADGWALLGRSYAALERYAEAAQAFHRANQLTQESVPDLLADEGESLALSRDRDLQGRPAQLFDQALSVAPDNAKALWYAGLAAEQAQDYKTAAAHWRKLAAQPIPEVLKTNLDARIAQLESKAGLPATMPASQPAAPQPVAAAAVKLDVRIKVKPELQKQVDPAATLFVFAKAASGPPMPLAVQRLPASKLPLEVVLDDSQGMIPTLKLSQFDRWTVTARVSKGGSAQPVSGDLQGVLEISRSDLGHPIDLVIDQVVP